MASLPRSQLAVGWPGGASGLSSLARVFVHATLIILASFAVLAQSAAIQWAFYPIPTSLVATLVAGILGICALLLGVRVRFDSIALTVLFLIFIPFVASLCSLLAALALGPGMYDAPYMKALWGRILNVGMFTYFFVFCWAALRDSNDALLLLTKVYYWTIGIMVACGLWQWAHLYLHVPFPNLASVHTAINQNTLEEGTSAVGRLSSFLREPSYFASYLWDFVVITPLLIADRRQWLLRGAALFCLLFSFSFGGIVEAAAMAVGFVGVHVYYLAATGRVKLGQIFAAIGALAAILIALPRLLEILSPMTNRLTSFLADPLREVRLLEIYGAVLGTFNGTTLQVLFGHGPASFELLQRTDLGLSRTIIHTTSNCIYSDILFEQGLVGLFALLALLIITLWHSLAVATYQRFYRPLPLLTIALAASGLYKADHNNLRFWVLLLITWGFIFVARQAAAREPRVLARGGQDS